MKTLLVESPRSKLYMVKLEIDTLNATILVTYYILLHWIFSEVDPWS